MPNCISFPDAPSSHLSSHPFYLGHSFPGCAFFISCSIVNWRLSSLAMWLTTRDRLLTAFVDWNYCFWDAISSWFTSLSCWHIAFSHFLTKESQLSEFKHGCPIGIENKLIVAKGEEVKVGNKKCVRWSKAVLRENFIPKMPT